MPTVPKSPYNRRSYARLNIDAHAIIYLNNNLKKGIKLKNISPRGAGGEIDFFLQPGEKVAILLFYPFFEEPLKKEVKISWCSAIDKKTWGIGFDFENNILELTNYFQQNKAV